MEVKRIFKGKDYLLGRWINNLIIASEEGIEYYESFTMNGNFEITLIYDNKKIKKLIKKAYKEMQKGNI